jgi:hypothetical protein
LQWLELYSVDDRKVGIKISGRDSDDMSRLIEILFGRRRDCGKALETSGSAVSAPRLEAGYAEYKSSTRTLHKPAELNGAWHTLFIGKIKYIFIKQHVVYPNLNQN